MAQKPRVSGRIAVLAILIAIKAYPAGWQIQAVDAGGGGKYATLLIDKFGNAHASYASDTLHQLKYAFWDHRMNKWFTMTVDGNRCGGFVSMALDSHQRPHISYLDYGTARLKYAYWDGSIWHRQTIEIASWIEYYTSITLDSEDRPIISYYDVRTPEGQVVIRLRVVRFAGRVWETETIDSTPGSGKFNSIASNAGRDLQIAYADVSYERQSLRWARWNGRSWNVQVLEGVDQPRGIFSVKLVIDNDGTPHIAYTDRMTHAVKYATLRDGKWQMELVDRLAYESYPDRNGIALDPSGVPYLSYYDGDRGVLRVAHRDSSKWVAEEVDSGFAGFTSAIQVTSDEVMVLYYDATTDSLKCARRPVDSVKSHQSGPGDANGLVR